MKKIEMSKNKFAIVDDEDYDILSAFTWFLNGKGYAVRQIGRKQERMHRFILGKIQDNHYIDHINRDKLDNRKENLRVCTQTENNRNRGKQRNNSSGYKGIYKTRFGKYMSLISINGKLKYLGIFTNKEDAARAYDTAAKEHYGNFAVLNF